MMSITRDFLRVLAAIAALHSTWHNSPLQVQSAPIDQYSASLTFFQTLHLVGNFSFFKVSSKFSPDNPLSNERGVRYGNTTWQDFADTIHEGGHFFCAVARDNWSCLGNTYIQMLRELPRFNESLFYASMPSQSVVLGIGNSFFAELWAPVLCMPTVHVWNIGGALGNSYIAYETKADILLVLFDNVEKLSPSSRGFSALLRKLTLQPNIIVLGDENPGKTNMTSEESAVFDKEYFERTFPLVPIIEARGRKPLLTRGCRSCTVYKPDKDCVADATGCHGNHGCYPGPAYRGAEKFWEEVGSAMSRGV
mgnify:CR=1 FL=1